METLSKPVAEPEYEVLQIVSTSCSEISSKYKEVLKFPERKSFSVSKFFCQLSPH